MTHAATEKLIGQLRVLHQLTNSEIQIAQTRQVQARNDTVRQQFTTNAANAQQRAKLIAAANEAGVPLTVLDLDGPGWREHFGAALVLVRPDQHVSWAGAAVGDPRELIRTVIGHDVSSGR